MYIKVWSSTTITFNKNTVNSITALSLHHVQNVHPPPLMSCFRSIVSSMAGLSNWESTCGPSASTWLLLPHCPSCRHQPVSGLPLLPLAQKGRAVGHITGSWGEDSAAQANGVGKDTHIGVQCSRVPVYHVAEGAHGSCWYSLWVLTSWTALLYRNIRLEGASLAESSPCLHRQLTGEPYIAINTLTATWNNIHKHQEHLITCHKVKAGEN